MNLSLLLLFPLIGGPPVRFEPPTVREPAAKVQTIKVTRRAGDHSHLCPRCRHEFWHGSASFGNARDHHCPACGYGPVWQVYRR